MRWFSRPVPVKNQAPARTAKPPSFKSRLAAGLALLMVAGVTGVISYLHIYGLTLTLHQPELVARLQPFGVDGLIVVGSIVLLQAPPSYPRLGWLGIGPGVVISVFANVESGIKFGPLAAAWAGVSAVSFALSTFMFERWLKGWADALAAASRQPAPLPVRLRGRTTTACRCRRARNWSGC
jgi:hypothetical protein